MITLEPISACWKQTSSSQSDRLDFNADEAHHGRVHEGFVAPTPQSIRLRALERFHSREGNNQVGSELDDWCAAECEIWREARFWLARERLQRAMNSIGRVR